MDFNEAQMGVSASKKNAWHVMEIYGKSTDQSGSFEANGEPTYLMYEIKAQNNCK